MEMKISPKLEADASYEPPPALILSHRPEHAYHVVYDNPETGEHWEDDFKNIVPDVAQNAILSTIYGSTAKPAGLYLGLVTGPGAGNTYAAGDTMGGHGGWTEAVPYSNANRPTATFPATATAKAISNSGSPAVFNINGSATIAGMFLCDSNAKSGGSGVLFGVGNFSSGDKAVSAGGTLTVTITATIS